MLYQAHLKLLLFDFFKSLHGHIFDKHVLEQHRCLEVLASKLPVVVKEQRNAKHEAAAILRLIQQYEPASLNVQAREDPPCKRSIDTLSYQPHLHATW